MDFDNVDSEKVGELRALEQSIQAVGMQKQAFQMEVSEVEHALEELKKSEGDVFRIVGSVMIKSDKGSISEDLERKMKLLNLRLKSLESQEVEINERAEKLRKEVEKSFESGK